MFHVPSSMPHVLKGFTLFETIISIGLLALIVGSFSGFVVSMQNTRNSLHSMQEVDENLRLAADVIAQKIRSANGVNAALSTFDTDPGFLSLSMTDVSANPTLFYLDQDNGRIMMQEGSSLPIALTTNEIQIYQLIFSLLSGMQERENVRITLDAQMRAISDSYASYEHTITTSASIRQ